MKKNNTGYDIAIVGAGIAGLAAARRIEEFNQLHKQNKIRYIVL